MSSGIELVETFQQKRLKSVGEVPGGQLPFQPCEIVREPGQGEEAGIKNLLEVSAIPAARRRLALHIQQAALECFDNFLATVEELIQKRDMIETTGSETMPSPISPRVGWTNASSCSSPIPSCVRAFGQRADACVCLRAGDPPPPRQEGSAEAAFVGTSGSASTSTFSAGAEHIARPTSWMIRNRAHFVRGTAEGTVTAESLLYGFRAERSINDRLSAFGDLGLFRDEPAGISSRAALLGGLPSRSPPARVRVLRWTPASVSGRASSDRHGHLERGLQWRRNLQAELSDTADLSGRPEAARHLRSG
jgi:hypothetical protein